MEPALQTDIPALTTEQMIEVDRLMTDCYGITLTHMMENAGRNLVIGDISVPPILYSRLGFEVNPQLYVKDPVVRL